MRKEAGRAVLSRPSFETTAFGGLLRMRPLFAVKSLVPHGEERRPCDASRTMRPRSFVPERPYAIALPLRGGVGVGVPHQDCR